MFKFAEDVMQLPGRHRTDVFALLIAKLACYPAVLLGDKRLIKSLVSEIKILFHNHEQHFAGLQFIIRQNMAQYRSLSLPLGSFLMDVLASLGHLTLNDYFKKTNLDEKDLACSFQRYFESQLATHLLLNPSQMMWDSVNEVSKGIIFLLEGNITDTPVDLFLDNLGPLEPLSEEPLLALAFGRFAHRPKVVEVIAVLKDKNQLATIMLIHFMFMRDIYPYVKLHAYPPFLGAYGGDLEAYLSLSHHEDLRPFFYNYPLYAPHLYTDRGRLAFHFILSKQLGISLSPEDRIACSSTENAWFPDCLCQEANLNSPYVQSMIQRDIPYVAGPSGMTSQLCAAMVFLGQWHSLDKQHYYLLATMAFITGGGLHSMHEVLTIPKTRLGLLPEYKTQGEMMGNYHDFFSLFHRDEVFQDNIDDAWVATIDWIRRRYPHLMDLSPEPIRPGSMSRAVDCIYETIRHCFF